jgi:GAF domain-containing protein
MTTSLVLGLFALFESLFERTALGHRASLVLELAVPLGLGVSLSTVHRRIDALVDRLIFRRQYQEEVALRRFANESAFVSQPETLLDLAVEQILLHVGAPWVAFYEYGSEGYRRVRQRGEVDLPPTVATDDLALVKLRAHESDVDLHEAPSGLGREGYAFPLRARGHLLGALVVGPRPGEHYAAEERELMARVAHAVGASLFALRAQATEEQLKTTRAEAAARESVLLEALRALGAEPRVSTEG